MFNEPLYIIPIVLVSFLVELIIDVKEHRNTYELRDSLTSLSISLMSIGATMLCRSISLSFLFMVYRYAFFKFQFHWYEWISGLILLDFLAYIFHLVGHKSRVFWIVHAPHHSSERFNFATAIRTPVFNACFRFIFWAPMCLVGYSPTMIISLETFMYFYTFFLHTEMVTRLGWLESILNTPSHHRVHHGIDDKYLDKNFGCVFIVWDRLFGTFQPEIEKPKYGIINQKASFNPFKIVFSGLSDVVFILNRVQNPGTLLKLLFGPPTTIMIKQQNYRQPTYSALVITSLIIAIIMIFNFCQFR